MDCNLDLLFVLAGRESRKEYALHLFANGIAKILLFSIGRFEIRRFERLGIGGSDEMRRVAAGLPPPARHFFLSFNGKEVEIDVMPKGRFGTLSEVKALKAWLNANPEISNIAVVSSWYHLPRIVLCCRRLISGHAARFIASRPFVPRKSLHMFWDDFIAALSELYKIPMYWVLLTFSDQA